MAVRCHHLSGLGLPTSSSQRVMRLQSHCYRGSAGVPFACHIVRSTTVTHGLPRSRESHGIVLNPAFAAGQNDARVDLENRWVAIPRGFESLALRPLTCGFVS